MPRRRREAILRTQWETHPWARYLISGWDSGPLTGCSHRQADPLPREEVKALWDQVGEEVLEWFADRTPGRRPWAWFEWDAPEPLREGETQEQYLRRHRLLSPAEKKRLQDPDGPGLPPGCRVVQINQPRRNSGKHERND